MYWLWQVHERNIEEVLPQVISAVASFSSNNFNTVQSGPQDEFLQTSDEVNNIIDGLFVGKAHGVENIGVADNKRDTLLTHIQDKQNSQSYQSLIPKVNIDVHF